MRAWLGAGLALTIGYVLFACASAPGMNPQRGPATLTSGSLPEAGMAPSTSGEEGLPYRLSRTVYTVELDKLPLTRTRCWVSSKSTKAEIDSQVLEWDPSGTAPLIRRVALRRNGAELRCASEQGQAGREGSMRAFTYDWHDCQTADGANESAKDAGGGKKTPPKPATSDAAVEGGATAASASAAEPLRRARCATFVDLNASTNKATLDPVKQSLDVRATIREEGPDAEPEVTDEKLVTQRSLDPLTPVLTELLTVIAEVAIDKAKAGATEALKSQIKNTICRLQFEEKTSLEEQKQTSTIAKKEPGKEAGVEPTSEDAATVQVFSRVCRAIDAVRIEEIASSSKLLARALAGDLTEFAFRKLRSQKQPSKQIGAMLDSLENVLLSLVEGRSISTERDFQGMLLRLAKIPVRAADANKSTPGGAVTPDLEAVPVRLAMKVPADTDYDHVWKCGLGIGFSVLRECLRRDACGAEQLQTSLANELEDENSGSGCEGAKQVLKEKWPDLGAVLARAVDVFRPPPGTPPNVTAKVATNVLLDALKKHVELTNKDATGEALRALKSVEAARGLVNGLFDKDYVAATVSATALIVAQIEKDCGEQEGTCVTDVTSDGLNKGIAILNGFISYASTYSESARAGEEGKTDAEREKLRHEERKKAMESLINSATDRSNRGGHAVFSLGVGVGLGIGRIQQRKLVFDDLKPFPQLSLPMGLTVQKLPSGTSFSRSFGWHTQLVLLDLGQYVSMKDTGDNKVDVRVAKADIASAFVFGLQGGALIGGPRYNMMIGLDFGYQPGLRFSETERAGMWRAGLFLGSYVPLFDFN